MAVLMLFSNLATIVSTDVSYLISATRSTSDDSYVQSISGDYMISGMLVDKLFHFISRVTGVQKELRESG